RAARRTRAAKASGDAGEDDGAAAAGLDKEPGSLSKGAGVPGAKRAALPTKIEPELATLVSDAPAGDDWLHEIKLDGYRILARLEGGRVSLYTRKGKDWTSTFAGVARALAEL